MTTPPNSPMRLEIHIPASTIVRVLATALVVAIVIRVWPEIIFFLISLLLAITLNPAVRWGERHGVPRGAGVGLLAVSLLALVAAFSMLVMPPLVEQAAALVKDFPAMRDRVQHHIVSGSPVLKRVVDEVFLLMQSREVAEEVKPLIWGKAAVSGAMSFVLVLITTLYLLLDGRRFYAWIIAYVPREHREKAAATIPEVSKVVSAYVRGQGITSLLFAIFVAILLGVLGVPAVLPLAVFAALCDVIPVVGIVIAVAPAALLALTVRPSAALIVTVSYLSYHLFETYVIVPRVYGKKLRLSAVAVIIALTIAGSLQGIIGAVLVLPLVAAYPIIERIWLKDYLGQEVLRDHAALEAAAETAREQEVVEKVLQGEEHPGDGSLGGPPQSAAAP